MNSNRSRDCQQPNDQSEEQKMHRDNPFKEAEATAEKNKNKVEEEIKSVQEKKEAMTERD